MSVIREPRKIVWLASYPKSGNTWFRIFLANLQNNGTVPIDINALEKSLMASNRLLFDEATGISSADLTFGEIEALRPEVYEHIARQSEDLVFQKIHDAYTCNISGKPLIPESATRCVLYFVRNPLDVAVSFAHHNNTSCAAIIGEMNNDEYSFYQRPDKLNLQLTQRLLTWSNHVLSWVDDSGLPLKVIRYEDMKERPFETFKAAIEFVGFACNDEQIEKAIRFSSFDILREQEQEKGFREKSPSSKSFFRKGLVGSWKEELSPGEAQTVIQNHHAVMERFGYLP
jgi:hypothetical protein